MPRIKDNDIVCALCGQAISEWFPRFENDAWYHRECYSNLNGFKKNEDKADKYYRKILDSMKAGKVHIWTVKSFERPGELAEERIEDAKRIVEIAQRFTAMERPDEKDCKNKTTETVVRKRRKLKCR